MGIIQKQAIKSSIFLLIGFAIGGINILFLFPKLISLDVNGLTRAFLDVGVVLSMLATIGSVPVIVKFFPFYKSHLKNEAADRMIKVSGDTSTIMEGDFKLLEHALRNLIFNAII